MKTFLTILCCTLLYAIQAQEIITKTYQVLPGQQLNLSFDYPKIVKLSTWNKNEVSITASVNINNGENNDAFQLIESVEGNTLTVKNKIKDMDKLPKRYTVMKDGKKTVFTSKEAYKEFKADLQGAKYYAEGTDIDITIDIKVPESLAATYVKSTYGVVELVNFNGQLKADATYGAIDVSVNESATGKLSATTHYGQIYSNLKLNIIEKEERDFYTSITITPGKGPAYLLQSTYGNLYLRKSLK